MGKAVTGPCRFGRRLAAPAVLMLFCAARAWANQPPGPQMVLGEILILPLMMLLTALGGGYAVMRAQGAKRRRFWWVAAVAAIFLSGMQEGLALIVMLMFGVVALSRGSRMILWGIAATRPAETRPAHLAQAVPHRLVSAGAVTALAGMGVGGLAFAFIGWWPGEGYVEHDLKRLVAYQVARGKQHKDTAGNPQYEAFPVARDGSAPPRFVFEELGLIHLRPASATGHWYFATEFRLGPGARSFEVWVWPRRMPIFPYNYLVTLPSFYADETGQIRMLRVHWAGQRCPPNALAYYRSRPEDLQSR